MLGKIKIDSCSIFYVLFAWFLGVCYGFVLISSAAGQNGDIRLFEPGESLTYQWHSSILQNEKGEDEKHVGFKIEGEVNVQTVWGQNNEKILKIQIKSPQLNVKSRKAPSPDGFVPHASELEKYSNKPFLVVWKSGKIQKILLPQAEPISLANLKKGVASLFQFQLLDGESTETDGSGICFTKYSSLSPNTIQKTKSSCISSDLPYIKNPDQILQTQVDSSRTTTYELDSTSLYLKAISSKELHQMYVTPKEDLGSYIESEQTLRYLRSEKVSIVKESNIDSAIEKISQSEGVTYTQETLLTEKEPIAKDEVKKFTKEVENLRENLQTKYLGEVKAAKAFVKLLDVARLAKKEDVSKVLDSKKNKKILPQLYDLLGYAQTDQTHEAVTKKLHFDNEEQIDSIERYLWALSFSSQPNPDIISDLLNKYKKYTSIPEKVKETLILTIASMTRRFSKLPNVNMKIIQNVEETILNDLEYAKGEARYPFFRALKNLLSESTIPTLISFIQTGTSKEGVLAWNALKSFDRKLWNKELLKVAEKTFFQLDRKHDTSSRTMAADMLLQSQPTDEILTDALNFLISDDPAFEVKQYFFQSVRMLAEKDESLNRRVQNIIESNPKLNNWSGLSPRGSSTALTTTFYRSASSNGSCVSLQELKSGIVKRGIVSVVVEKNEVSKEMCSLGIFSAGIDSFVAKETEQEPEETESPTAGMQLTVMGTQIRPFVFFNGQGELMGHVWSGTASERTTAFQALILLQDHLEYLRLGSGFIAELNLKGASSFDLSGKIEISLWNRNAETLIEKSAGIVITGTTKIDTSFVRSQVEFIASVEPKLSMQIDVDFSSSNVKLCMRLSQPTSLFRNHVFKIERIPGSKHKIRIAKYKKSHIAGATYFLNRKNNEMCSAMSS